jgi:hypothetical protein
MRAIRTAVHLVTADSTTTTKYCLRIEEEAEDVCMGSSRENRCIIIGNNKDDNKANKKIRARIKGADLRRFDKYKKRPHLTSAPLWCNFKKLSTMHQWSYRSCTLSSLI